MHGRAGDDERIMTSFDDAVRRFRRRGGRGHLLVRHRGATVVDERLGVGPEAAFWPFSVSKLWIATLTWALHDDGVLDVDRPVADYWPEFAAHGKESVTVLDALRHRSGVPRAGSMLAEVAAMVDWPRAAAAVAATPPIRAPHEPPAYEWLAWGFILGEAVRRATGIEARELPELLRARILAPLDAEGTSLGLTRADAWRAVPFTGRDPSSAATAAVLNRPVVRRAIIPAGGVSTRAVDLVALLEAIGDGGGRLGMRPGTVARMLAPSNAGEFDRYAGSRVWWGHGVQLGHPGPRAFAASAFGRRSSPRAFGHNGSNVSIAWHDPDRDLTFVVLSGLIEPFPVNRLRLMAIEDAALAAADELA